MTRVANTLFSCLSVCLSVTGRAGTEGASQRSVENDTTTFKGRVGENNKIIEKKFNHGKLHKLYASPDITMNKFKEDSDPAKRVARITHTKKSFVRIRCSSWDVATKGRAEKWYGMDSNWCQ